ncbi:MAG: glycogen/starch synthase, partial [Cocleimonas sp.]|nr:glycogen/starch synthase [Cocleimonas sp.]
TYTELQLPPQWWSSEGVEFYGKLSLLKAGLIYADAITTVSPTYAKEICTPAFGYGMEGILSSRHYKLSGILNGIDTTVWNPEQDTLIPHHFTSKQLKGKQKNKQALLTSYGIKSTKNQLAVPLLGMVSRLVEQKGVDMVVEAIPQILAESEANFVLIGTGHPYFETRLRQLNQQYPDRVFITIGYDESQAHLLEAACDLFLMPSRFEPCGLNQMYSLRYGTLPIVHRTGGLADTVVDAQINTENKLEKNSVNQANGFVFNTPDTAHLLSTIQRALTVFKNKSVWQQLQHNAMNQDFSWDKSAQRYLNRYR